MPAAIKAIVFKTAQLKETKQFFESALQLKIKETSARHFVIYSKGIRIIFIESSKQFDVEIYISSTGNLDLEERQFNLLQAGFKRYTDPNGITIIISH